MHSLAARRALPHVYVMEAGGKAASSPLWGSGAATVLHSSNAPSRGARLNASVKGLQSQMAHGRVTMCRPARHPVQARRAEGAGVLSLRQPNHGVAFWGGHAVGQHTLRHYKK
jgi:hypothetical protein